jgi:hypothetical protein
MKIKYLFLSTVAGIVMTLNVSAQNSISPKARPVKSANDISNVMGNPVFESTVDSLNTKVWIVTQKKNRDLRKTKTGNMMGKMKEKNMATDTSTIKAIKAGTHYLILDVINIRSGKQFADTSAKVEVVSPSKNASSVNLQPMMNHFGGGMTLDEKGEYLFTINLNIGAGYKTSQFKYMVK